MKLHAYFKRKNKYLNRFKWRPPTDAFKRVFCKTLKRKKKIKLDGNTQILNLQQEISNFEHVKAYKFNVNKVPRKIKFINIYSLRYSEGTIKKAFKRVTLNYYKEYLGIKKDNKIVGFTPSHVGFRPGKPVVFDNIFVKYLSKNFYKFKNFKYFNELIKSLSEYKETYTGSPDTNMGHLRKFTVDNRKIRYSNQKLFEICALGKWFQVPELDFSDPREMYYITNHNPKSNNGHYTSRILGTSQKGYSIYGAVNLAVNLYNQVRETPMRNYCLWDILAREKEIKLDPFSLNKDYTTRVVVNPEHHVTHLLSWVFQKLMLGCERTTSERSFYLTGEYDGFKAGNMLRRFSKFDFVADADWSKFDSSIDTNELIVAGVLMFSASIKTKEDYRFFFYIISSFVTKYLALPPGIVCENNRGNPSGHPGVTAINCFVNLIRWSVIGYEIYGKDFSQHMSVVVYGDDTFVGFNNIKGCKLFEIDNIIKTNGWECDSVLDRLYPGSFLHNGDINENPDYLKRVFNHEGLSWNPKKIFDKIFFQSRKRSVEEQIKLIYNFIETAPCNDDLNSFLLVLVKESIVDFKDDLSKEIIDFMNNFIIDKSRFLNTCVKDKLEFFNKEVELSKVSVCEFKYDKTSIGNITPFNKFRIIQYLSHNHSFLNYFKETFIKRLVVTGSSNMELNVYNYYEISKQYFSEDIYSKFIKLNI